MCGPELRASTLEVLIHVRHKTIHKRCLLLDQLIDGFNARRRGKNFPRKQVDQLMPMLFPGSIYAGRGFFKTVHKVSSRARDLVVKTAPRRSLESDLEVYRRIPKEIRNRYFAKIYWSTKYCLLQKFGGRGRVPRERLEYLKRMGRDHGLTDINAKNIRKIDGAYKIVDANLSKKGRRHEQ